MVPLGRLGRRRRLAAPLELVAELGLGALRLGALLGRHVPPRPLLVHLRARGDAVQGEVHERRRPHQLD